MKKKTILYITLPLLALTLLIGGTTYAATANTAKNNPFNKIATTIAQKFNLNTAEVQTIIDETMATERAQMGKNHPAKINKIIQAVTDGKLTQVQADLITAKKTELQTSSGDIKNMTKLEREAVIKTHQDTLKQWAIANNIPEEYVIGFGGMGMGRGGERNFKGMGLNKNNPPTTATK